MPKRIAVISAILEQPEKAQQPFNDIVASFRGLVRGRMGIPFDEEDMAVIALTVEGDLDHINHLTGRLGALPGISVKTAISKRETGSDRKDDSDEQHH